MVEMFQQAQVKLGAFAIGDIQNFGDLGFGDL
jgi:hypothetical protein